MLGKFIFQSFFRNVTSAFTNSRCRNKYAVFKSIRTMTIPVSSKAEGAGGRTESSKKAKLLITLQRGPDFCENMRKFAEIKEENDRLAAKTAAANGETKADKDEK